MDPLADALSKHYGMSPDLAARVAQNLRTTPGPHPGYEAAEQEAGMGAAYAQVLGQSEQPPVVQSSPGRSYREAQGGQVAVTSAAIAQQFGVPPSGAVELAEKLHGMVPASFEAGLESADPRFEQIKQQRLREWSRRVPKGGMQTLPEYETGGLPPRPPEIRLEAEPAQVEQPKPIELEVGPVSSVSFEVPKGQESPQRLQQLASAYWTHNKDPYTSTYWASKEKAPERDQVKAEFLANLKALRARDPAAAKRAVALGFKASQDSYRAQQKKRDHAKRH